MELSDSHSLKHENFFGITVITILLYLQGA